MSYLAESSDAYHTILLTVWVTSASAARKPICTCAKFFPSSNSWPSVKKSPYYNILFLFNISHTFLFAGTQNFGNKDAMKCVPACAHRLCTRARERGEESECGRLSFEWQRAKLFDLNFATVFNVKCNKRCLILTRAHSLFFQ